MSESKKKTKTIFAEPTSFRTEFVDAVQSVSREDILILEFLQSLPDALSEDDSQPVRISARLAFTWAHVEKLRDLLNRAIEKRNNKPVSGDNNDND